MKRVKTLLSNQKNKNRSIKKGRGEYFSPQEKEKRII